MIALQKETAARASGGISRRAKGLLVALVMAWALGAWFLTGRQYDRRAAAVFQRESRLAQSQADSVAQSVRRSLAYLHGIPAVLSHEETVVKVLRDAGPSTVGSGLSREARRELWTADARLAPLNGFLSVAASGLVADVVWLLNSAGDCIASSNAGTKESFVGVAYPDREYFQEARAGRAGRQFAMGRMTNIPGLFYSSPVMGEGRFMGAVVVKVNVPELAFWLEQAEAFIADSDGVVILARRKAMEMRTLPGATVAKLPEAQRLSRYKRTEMPGLGLEPWGDDRFAGAVLVEGLSGPQVLASHRLPDDSVDIFVTRSLGEIKSVDGDRSFQFLLLAAAGSILILGSGGLVLYLSAIRHAREGGVPFLGTCGGFQHAIIEYARDVLGWPDAEHAETAPDAARAVISLLECALVETAGVVRFVPGSRIASAYGATEATERYRCRYGLNAEFRSALLAGPLRATAEDEDGEVRAVELDNHPFFVATLFQPERAALAGKSVPLVVAFVTACAA